MSIDIKTAHIEPQRLTFDHLEARIGKGKAATRYQEAVHDFQMTTNFHYRPTWEPEMELFDVRRTAIRLEDFDALTDPRQYYYGPYTIQRARQQDHADSNFALIEKRNLFDALDQVWAARLRRLVVPLRHVEWGANTNNTYLSGYGYGAPFTSAALMQAMDRFGYRAVPDAPCAGAERPAAGDSRRGQGAVAGRPAVAAAAASGRRLHGAERLV